MLNFIKCIVMFNHSIKFGQAAARFSIMLVFDKMEIHGDQLFISFCVLFPKEIALQIYLGPVKFSLCLFSLHIPDAYLEKSILLPSPIHFVSLTPQKKFRFNLLIKLFWLVQSTPNGICLSFFSMYGFSFKIKLCVRIPDRDDALCQEKILKMFTVIFIGQGYLEGVQFQKILHCTRCIESSDICMEHLYAVEKITNYTI